MALQGTGVSSEQLAASLDGVELPEPTRRYRKYETGELRPDGSPGFNAPSGRFEIVSEWFRGYGYEPLPVYTEPTEGPRAAPELAGATRSCSTRGRERSRTSVPSTTTSRRSSRCSRRLSCTSMSRTQPTAASQTVTRWTSSQRPAGCASVLE